jgi:hypothetical protein
MRLLSDLLDNIDLVPYVRYTIASMYYTVLYCTVLYSVLCYATLYCAALHCALLYKLYCAALYCTLLCCIALSVDFYTATSIYIYSVKQGLPVKSVKRAVRFNC